MGAARRRISGTCPVFAALLSADDFFEGLEVRQTPLGPEYRKGSQVMTEFPQRVNVSVKTWVWKCGTAQPEDPALAKSVLEKLRLEASWKSGMKTRPVKEWSVRLRKPSLQEWMEDPATKKLKEMGLEPRDPDADGVWLFELTIRDEKIPLSDSLIIIIKTEDGKLAARFAGRL